MIPQRIAILGGLAFVALSLSLFYLSQASLLVWGGLMTYGVVSTLIIEDGKRPVVALLMTVLAMVAWALSGFHGFHLQPELLLVAVAVLVVALHAVARLVKT